MRAAKYISSTLLLSSFVLFARAQGPFTMEAYLETAYKDQALEMYHAQLNFLDDNKYNSPWLNRVELRIGTEDANFSMDEFRLRLSPSNPFEVRANKIYHRKHISRINAAYTVALNEALKNRYQLLLDHFYLTHLRQLLENQQQEQRKLMEHLQLMSTTGFDAGDLIDLESEMSDILISIEKLKLEISETEFYMSMDIPSEISIDWEKMEVVTIDQIKNYIESIRSQEQQQNIFVKEAEEELLLNEQMLKINRSEARSNIGYIQGNLDANRGETFTDHFGVQIGVRLPIVNPDKPDLNRDRFDLIEDKSEITVTKSLVEQRSELLLLRLRHLFDQNELLSTRIKNASQLSPSMTRTGTLDIMQILKRQEYTSELIKEQLDLKKEVIDTFIDYLDIRGYLVSTPVKNYMSANFAIIGE